MAILIFSGALSAIFLVGLCLDHRHHFVVWMLALILSLVFFLPTLFSFLTPKTYSTNRTTVARYELCPMSNGLYVQSAKGEITFCYQKSQTETLLGTVDEKYADIQFQINGETPKVYVVHETDYSLFSLLEWKILAPKSVTVERLYFRSPSDKTDIQ